MEFLGLDISREKQSMATTWEIAIPDTSTKATGTTDPDTGRDSPIVSH